MKDLPCKLPRWLAELRGKLHRVSIASQDLGYFSAIVQALVAPLSGGAAAARAAILGARNALEPERYEDRRLAQ